jgi:N-acetylmuramoyl-L-alanine amidase
MAKICLNAGHTITGGGTGAIGLMIESVEARKIVGVLKKYLEIRGHSVTLANVDEAKTQGAYLQEVVRKANASDADLFVSIHFNAGKGLGSECYTYEGKKVASAVGVCDELSKLGFINRGVKDGSGLYVIRKTKMPAVLVEVCFVDSRGDYDLYKKLGVNIVSQAITRGIVKGL